MCFGTVKARSAVVTITVAWKRSAVSDWRSKWPFCQGRRVVTWAAAAGTHLKPQQFNEAQRVDSHKSFVSHPFQNRFQALLNEIIQQEEREMEQVRKDKTNQSFLHLPAFYSQKRPSEDVPMNWCVICCFCSLMAAHSSGLLSVMSIKNIKIYIKLHFKYHILTLQLNSRAIGHQLHPHVSCFHSWLPCRSSWTRW